jgi:hypothetical protein
MLDCFQGIAADQAFLKRLGESAVQGDVDQPENGTPDRSRLEALGIGWAWKPNCLA